MMHVRVIYTTVLYTINKTEYCSSTGIPKKTSGNAENGITIFFKLVGKLQDDVITLRKSYAQKNYDEINFLKEKISLSYKQLQFKSVLLKASTLSGYRATLKDYLSAFLVLERYDETIRSNLTVIKPNLENIIRSLGLIIDRIDGSNVRTGPRFNEKEIIITTKTFINTEAKSSKDNITFRHKIICYVILNQFSNFLLNFEKVLHIFPPYFPQNGR